MKVEVDINVLNESLGFLCNDSGYGAMVKDGALVIWMSNPGETMKYIVIGKISED